jgi:hypothetical protein
MSTKESIGECQDHEGNIHQLVDVVSTPSINGTELAIFEMANGSFAIQITAEREGEPLSQNMMLTQQQYAMLFMTMHASIEKFTIPMEVLSRSLVEMSRILKPDANV